MRIQINNGLLEGLSDNTVIAFGDCQGDNTYEIACETPFDLNENMISYEAEIENNFVIRFTLKESTEILS